MRHNKTAHNSDGNSMENMIIQLQEIVAHQGEGISNLHDELYAQKKEIATLRAHINELQRKLEETHDETGTIELDRVEKPPHY